MTEGQLLRKARLKLKLTQIALGKHMGWCDMFISRIESDISGVPLKSLIRLCKKLKVKKEVFLKAKFRKIADQV